MCHGYIKREEENRNVECGLGWFALNRCARNIDDRILKTERKHHSWTESETIKKEQHFTAVSIS